MAPKARINAMETMLQNEWVPCRMRGRENVRDHMGNTPAPEARVFARPPEQIGRILSVESTMTAEQCGASMPVKLASAAAACSAGAVTIIPWLLICWRCEDWQSGAVCMSFVLLLILAVTLAFRALRCRFTCTFVGTAGLARFTQPARPRASSGANPRCELLLFRNAAALRASVTHGYRDGVYTGTRFRYAWFDARGSRLFKISGGHHAFESASPASKAFHFAVAAESAWSRYVQCDMQPRLDRDDALPYSSIGRADAA
jgi:hypothetical protein